MIKQIRTPKVKLSGSVHKSGDSGGSRSKKDVDVKAGAKAPPKMSDMTEAAMKSSGCSQTKSRVNRVYGYKQTVKGNEAGK